MALSKFLDGMRSEMKELVAALKPYYKYVSILGTDSSTAMYHVDRATSSVSAGGRMEGECGFVVKVHDGNAFGEYSLSSIAGDKKALAQKIVKEIALNKVEGAISCPVPADPVHKESFVRESDFDNYSDDEVLKFCTDLKDEALKRDEKIVNAIVVVSPFVVNKLFISENRELDQHYGWVNGYVILVYRDGKIAHSRESAYGNQMKDVFDTLPQLLDKAVEMARHLVKATPIEPGVYDIITDSSITGLIAHEAFGHGVEMDQFVKTARLQRSTWANTSHPQSSICTTVRRRHFQPHHISLTTTASWRTIRKSSKTASLSQASRIWQAPLNSARSLPATAEEKTSGTRHTPA